MEEKTEFVADPQSVTQTDLEALGIEIFFFECQREAIQPSAGKRRE